MIVLKMLKNTKDTITTKYSYSAGSVLNFTTSMPNRAITIVAATWRQGVNFLCAMVKSSGIIENKGKTKQPRGLTLGCSEQSLKEYQLLEVLDDFVGKLAALYFSCAIHKAGKVVSYALVVYSTFKAFVY